MFCRNCGRELAGTPNLCPACGSGPLMGNRFCEVCGLQADVSGRCPRCTAPPAWPAQPERAVGIEEKKPSSSGALTAGGILTIVSGALGIVSGAVDIIVFRLGDSSIDIGNWEIGIGAEYAVLGPLGIVLGIVAIVGGVCALKKKGFGLAVTGAVCAILAGSICSWLPFVGLPMGIIALVFIATSKGKFGRQKVNTPQ